MRKKKGVFVSAHFSLARDNPEAPSKKRKILGFMKKSRVGLENVLHTFIIILERVERGRPGQHFKW